MTPKTATQSKKTESKIQQEIFRWFWNSHCLPSNEQREVIFHVPNENQHKLVSIGVYPGCSDLVISWKGKIYFVEVKTPTGTQSAKQKKFEQHVNDAGFVYYLVRSLEDFRLFLLSL